MRILITGGVGYLGSKTAEVLSAAGHRVVCLDVRDEPESWKQSTSTTDGITYVNGSVCDAPLVKELASSAEAIVHMAFVVGGPASAKQPEAAKRLARDGTEAVTAAADNQMLLFTSTDAIYSDASVGDTIDEHSECKPTSLYGELKLEAEDRIRNAEQSVILRLPSHFGVATTMREDLLVHCFVADMLRDGRLELFEPDITRTLIHVGDSADVVLFILENWDEVRNDTYNAASGSWTKRELAGKIAEISSGNVAFVESNAEASKVAKRGFTMDCGKIREKGWSPSNTDLTAGIKELWDYFSLRRR